MLGLLGIALGLVPVFLHTHPMPVGIDLLGGLIPVGLGVALTGTTRESRSRGNRPRSH